MARDTLQGPEGPAGWENMLNMSPLLLQSSLPWDFKIGNCFTNLDRYIFVGIRALIRCRHKGFLFFPR